MRINPEKDYEIEVLAISNRPTPVFTGEAAKKIIHQMEHPTDKTELFKRCKKHSKLFKRLN